jgi:hypothetical protein
VPLDSCPECQSPDIEVDCETRFSTIYSCTCCSKTTRVLKTDAEQQAWQAAGDPIMTGGARGGGDATSH